MTIVLRHSYIVNGHKLLCDAHTVPEQHRGAVALLISLTIVIFRFFYFYVVTLIAVVLFLGAVVFTIF